jgi:plastocyanin
MTRRQWVIVAFLVPLVAAGSILTSRALSGGDDAPGLQIGAADGATEFDWDYLIPAGTADRINSGENVAIVPAELTVAVGDTIRIVNEDDVDHVVGVFYVRAASTLTQQFRSAGELEGECSVHPSGAFSLTVVDA